MPMNINPHVIHHPFVNPEELPFPNIVLPGGGRMALYPAVKTRYPGNVGFGASAIGMPHPLGGPLGWGAGMGLDGTAASYRRYTGLSGGRTKVGGAEPASYILGRPLNGIMWGRGALQPGYWGGWTLRDGPWGV